MSHDQKPGRMRVVGSGQAQPLRRHGDQDPAAASLPEDAAEVAEAATTGRNAGLLLALLFVAGCAIGGAAIPLLGAI